MNFTNQKINNLFNYALIILFLVLISLPIIGISYGREAKLSERNNTENRKLAVIPEIYFDNFSFGSYTDKMEVFVNDNFGFRSELVKWNQLMHIKWFHSAPITSVIINNRIIVLEDNESIINNEEIIVRADDYIPTENLVNIQGDVIVGKDGWYYYAKEQVIDDFRGVIPLSNKELEQIKIKLDEKKSWLNNQGIEFVIMVSPNKCSIYPEYMPDSINKVQNKTRLDQLIEYLTTNSDIAIVDPRQNLIDAKEINYVYEITGTHWNEYGAFIAYQELAEYLQSIFSEIKPAQISDYNISTITAGGSDLAIMLSIQSYVQDKLVKLEKKNSLLAKDDQFLFDNPNPNPVMPLVAKKVENKKLPRALIFRDSFMNRLIPYLSENFSRSSYVWTYDINPEIVEIEKPDIVILEFVERKLGEVLLNIQ